MKTIELLRRGARKAASNPMMVLTVLVLVLIPAIYGTLFITGWWDPYNSMDQVPIAVVNLDQGASINGEDINIGRKLVDKLADNHRFKWCFVSPEEAQKGMDENRYYLTLTLPPDFSSKAGTVSEATPEQAIIYTEPNGTNNFIVAQIAGSAMKDLKAQVSTEVTYTYASAMMEEMRKLASGLQEAGNGASRLNDGANQLSDGIAAVEDGSNQLADGTRRLEDGLVPIGQGINDLQSGSQTLSDGNSRLASGLNDLSGYGHLLADGQSQALDGAVLISAGLAQSEDASAKLAEGSQQVADGLDQLAAAYPAMASNPEIQQLLAGSRAVADGNARLHEGQQQLLDGAKQLESGERQLNDGMKQFSASLDEAAQGSQKLSDGSSELVQGFSGLQDGVSQYASGVDQVAEGTRQLTDGTQQLQDGAVQLADGSGELAQRLNDAAYDINNTSLNDAVATQFAEPVRIEEDKEREIPQYGTALAPYFLSVALFVGCLAFMAAIPIKEYTARRLLRRGGFLRQTAAFAMIGTVQALLTAFIVLYAVGLDVVNPAYFIGFTLLTGISFMLILQALVIWLDNAGRFIAMITLIAQLITCGGTFPLELLPKWAQGLSPWLPMTHTVLGYKAVISSGNMTVLKQQALILVVYGLAFMGISMGYFLFHRLAAWMRSRKGAPAMACLE